jgi:hypothetical protein
MHTISHSLEGEIDITLKPGYYPKQKENIIVTKNELCDIIKKQFFSHGEIFNPDNEKDLTEGVISKQEVLESFIKHHSSYLYKYMLG